MVLVAATIWKFWFWMLCSGNNGCSSSNSGSSYSMSSVSNSRGSNSMSSISSIADSGNGRGSGGNGSSGSSSNWDMRNSVDWGSMSGHNSLAGVGLVCSVVDVGSLNDFLDGVNLVGSWDWNSTWDSNRDINVVFLDIDLWDNVGDLRGDSGVGSDGSSNLGLDNSVSRSRSSWDRGRGDGSIRSWGSRDGWG